MALSEADVLASLRTLGDPNTGRDFVSGKSVRKVQIDGGNVTVDLMLAYPARSQHEVLRKLVVQHLAALPGIGKVTVNISLKVASHAVQRGVNQVRALLRAALQRSFVASPALAALEIYPDVLEKITKRATVVRDTARAFP